MIRVTQLFKNFGEVEAISGINFEITKGQICGYLGPNGAGKTTTVKILTGVIKPSSGSASVAGFDVEDSAIEVKRRIGYVPENSNMYQTLSVNEYLALVGTLHDLDAAAIGRRSTQMLELFEIANASGKRIDTLSKGMRQKVLITSALLHDPEVLLLDEPLSGLDANAAQTVKEIIRGLADNGKTILYCSHMLDVVERVCDRVIILDQGKIIKDGTPAELMNDSNRSTLAKVFRNLTSGENQEEIAGKFVDIVKKREN